MKYILTHQREDSMSVSEAVEHIKKRTNRRQDSCARKFAEALMNLAPELAFWQNVPPDIEDLASAQLDQVTELLRQAVSECHQMDARTIGPWIYDVYAGLKNRERFGNKWNDPYPFFYKSDLRKSQLPLPLMRNFRANKTLMLSICNAAITELNPRRPKSEHTGSAFVNKAAKQVASALRELTDRQLSHRIIENSLRKFDSETGPWRRPIYAIVFVSAADTESELGKQYCYDVIVVSWSSESYSTSSHVVSLAVFTRKVREFLK